MATARTPDDEALSPNALESDLGWGLGMVFRSYVKAVNAVLGDMPGGPRGYQVLASAAQGQADSQGELCQRLGIDRTVLTYLIDDLEELGLVERQPNPADRRNRRIVATPKGQTLHSERHEALQHVEQQILSTLGDDSPVFRTLLQRLATQANELDPATNACQVIEQLTPLTKETPSPKRRR